MKRFMTGVTLLLAYSLLIATPARAAPGGELDATFGGNGRVVFESLFAEGVGFAGAQQPDGKMIIVGSGLAAGEPFNAAVLRLNDDGTLDPTFGSGGVALIDISAGYDDGYAMLLQPDGRIVVAGSAETSEGHFDFAIARLDTDGSADETFGNGGSAVLDLGGSEQIVTGVVLVENGKVVVAGYSNANTDYDFVLARFNSDGTLDTNFGTNGSVFVDFSRDNNLAFALTQQADGKLVACGSVSPSPEQFLVGDIMAARVNANGSVDTSFGVSGVAIVDTDTTIGYSASCKALPDQTIVLAGAMGDSDIDLALARLTSSGVLDQAFGVGGLVRNNVGRNEYIQAMLQLADGKFGVVGSIEDRDRSTPRDMFIARFNADGSPDMSFGNAGATIADFGNASVTADSEGLGILEQTDGKLVAIGRANQAGTLGFAIARVNAAGTGNVGVVGFVDTDEPRVAEGVGNIVLTARRTGGSVGAVTVDVRYLNDSAASSDDYRVIDSTVNWADGDTSDKTITIQIEDDEAEEVDESFTVVLENSSTAGLALAATSTVVTILSNDAQPPPPPPSGGGGATGLVLLALLGLLSVSAQRKRNAAGR